MEKRRRERINRSLEELKRLVLEAQNRDVSMLRQQKLPCNNNSTSVHRMPAFVQGLLISLEEMFKVIGAMGVPHATLSVFCEL